MSSPIDTCAGSSSGAQPPPDPSRLPKSGTLQPNYKYIKLIESVLNNQ